MKLNVSKGAHVNYLAKIVYVNKFTPHPNPEYTKLKVAHIVGYLPNGAYIQNGYDYGCIPPKAPYDYHE